MELMRRLAFTSFVSSGFTVPTSANLTSTMAGGVAIINGKYVTRTALAKTFTASKDTYVDITDDGGVTYIALTNGATTGMAITLNSDGSKALRIAKVVTSGTAITSVQQYGFDPLNNRIFNTGPIAGPNAPAMFYEEIGRTRLEAVGDIITATFPPRKFLKIIVASIGGGGGSIEKDMIFNGDNGNNYAFTYDLKNGNAFTAAVSQPRISLDNSPINFDEMHTEIEITNFLGRVKMVHAMDHYSGQSAAFQHVPFETWGHWANTVAQITSVSIVNNGAGNLGIGSEMIVLGHD
jgi:hypothetical protein